jgi:release factor glutamine methyltransferase
MKLKEYRDSFNQSLSDLYPQTEIDSFFYILIETFLTLKRIDLSLQPAFEMEKSHITAMNNALERLLQEEPVQYIVGKTEFYGITLEINESVLVPRPETEELVDWVLQDLAALSSERTKEILEIGTGSGCIPIAIAKNYTNLNTHAIEISKDALLVAKENANKNKVSINFIQTNILNVTRLPSHYDIMISNPPYVRDSEKKEIKKNVLDYEPHSALFVSDYNPLLFYNKIASLAKDYLNKEGALYFEINQYLGKETVALLEQKGFSRVELRKDLFGNDRMIKAQH